MDVVERNLAAFRVTVEELTRCVAVLLDDFEGEGDQELNVAKDWYAEKSITKQITDFLEKTVRCISSAKEVIEQILEVRSRASSGPTRASYRSHASSRSLIASSRAKEKAKVAELMAKVAMLEQKQELEKKAERLRLEEQLAVAHVRERVFAAEMENGVRDDLSHQPEMPSEAFRVPGASFSGPSFPPVSSLYTVPSATMNTVTNVNFTAGFHDDAPVTQAPPKPMRQPVKLNPLAPEFHVAETQLNTQFGDVLQKQNRLNELAVGGTTVTEFTSSLLAILWNISHSLESLNRKWKLKSPQMMLVWNTWSNIYKVNRRSSLKDVFTWIETVAT